MPFAIFGALIVGFGAGTLFNKWLYGGK